MSKSSRSLPRLWMLMVVGAACGLVIWASVLRVRQADYVSGLVPSAITVDPDSPTGYRGGLRQLIVPEHNNDSYQWIAQTQQMLDRKEWRLRHVDYDNAPMGRDVTSASGFRWWLGVTGWMHQRSSGMPMGISIERAAIWAGPLLQLLLIVSAVAFTARAMSGFAAGFLAVGIALLFPLTDAFMAGQPADFSVGIIAALWSVLPLVAGIGAGQLPKNLQSNQPTGKDPVQAMARARRYFALGGVMAGFGLWISPELELPILFGIALGGGFAALIVRGRRAEVGSPALEGLWRSWSYGGAATVLLMSLVEFFPSQLGGLRLWSAHPLHALAWLAAGELLAVLVGWIGRTPPLWTKGLIVRVCGAALVLGFVGAKMIPSWPTSLASERLSDLVSSPIAEHVGTWLLRDGLSLAAVGAGLPMVLGGIAGWILMRRTEPTESKLRIAFALGPVAIALGWACVQLRWFAMLDVALLGVAVAAMREADASPAPARRRLWSAALGLAALPAIILNVRAISAGPPSSVSQVDVQSLIERDLAHWLANRAGPTGAIVLAPPSLTTSLYFHGGLRGLGTPDTANKDGFGAALRIASASSPDEAQALMKRREVTYIVVPSWDSFLDEYARLGSNQPEKSLIGLLHQWLPPRWLRPIPYQLPDVQGFEGQSAVIFQVVDVQENAVALSHLADYFVEMSNVEQAASVGQALERLFPEDFGALIARAQVDSLRGDAVSFGKLVAEFAAYLKRGDDAQLPWERRVRLAAVLAEAKRFDLAQDQVKQCLEEVSEPDIRSLTTFSLYRFMVLTKIFNMPIEDPALNDLAQKLLPVEMRERIDRMRSG